MNKFILISSLLIISTQLIFSQEFEFLFHFEDANGNQDSLTLGLDDSATNGIDSFLGELNIIDSPFQEELDVRVSDEWSSRFSTGNPGTFHTKKQIVNSFYEIIEINIKASNFPITAKWNSSLFQNEELEGTLITSINPGGWWDTCSPSSMGRVILSEKDSIEFSSNVLNLNPVSSYSYITENSDIISVFWFVFGSEGIGVNTKNIELKDQIEIYPNPANEKLKIHNFSKILIEKIIIYNQTGQQVMESNNELLDIHSLNPGYYWIKIQLQNGQEIIKPITKS